MSFTPTNFEKKLSSLQETQDSIVSISQWVLFHHRHASQIAQIWADFFTPSLSSQKCLSLLYLCNDVVQQARHKRKPEFISSFAQVLPGVLLRIFHRLDNPIKPKVERLVRVWTERLVFASEQLDSMRQALDNSADTAGSATEAPATGSTNELTKSSSDSSIVPELRLLNDLFTHMNQLIDVSQTNLNQVGIQSKKYLPSDPSMSDSLPAPKIYISKLNSLEKICQTSNNNIESIRSDRLNILTSLNNLKKVVEEGLKTDESKKTIINSKLSALHKTRNELVELVNDTDAADSVPLPPSRENEQTSNGYEEDDDDDIMPTYESDSDQDVIPTPKTTPKPEIELPPSKRIKSKSKSVAFSENIEIKEYDRENQTEVIKIIKSDDDQTEFEEEDDGSVSDDFSRHHKDALELKHQENGNTEGEHVNNSVLDLLSKLQ